MAVPTHNQQAQASMPVHEAASKPPLQGVNTDKVIMKGNGISLKYIGGEIWSSLKACTDLAKCISAPAIPAALFVVK